MGERFEARLGGSGPGKERIMSTEEVRTVCADRYYTAVRCILQLRDRASGHMKEACCDHFVAVIQAITIQVAEDSEVGESRVCNQNVEATEALHSGIDQPFRDPRIGQIT